MRATLLNLKIEIARAKSSQAKIAKSIGISNKAMSNKLTEKSDFTRKEMYLIHKKFFPDSDFYKLFKSTGEEESK